MLVCFNMKSVSTAFVEDAGNILVPPNDSTVKTRGKGVADNDSSQKFSRRADFSLAKFQVRPGNKVQSFYLIDTGRT